MLRPHFWLVLVTTTIDDALASLAESDYAMEMATDELEAKDATIAQLTDALHATDATIARVRALVADPPEHDGRISTHWGDCYKVHRGCLAFAIRAALEGPSS